MTTLALSNGLRMLLTKMCDTMPIDGRIAMYTSGWPKNQNRCCHNSGEPPECGCTRSLMTKPAGMKKLVPACRSRISRMQAGRRTAKASKLMHEVMNHAQVQSGIRIKVMPLARRSRVVAMKFSAPSNEAAQKMAIDNPQQLAPHCMPGPASLPTALSGAYVVQNDIMLKRGNAMSSAPIWIGRK